MSGQPMRPREARTKLLALETSTRKGVRADDQVQVHRELAYLSTLCGADRYQAFSITDGVQRVTFRRVKNSV